MSFYKEMQDIASSLLYEFDQGGCRIKVYQSNTTTKPWDPSGNSYATSTFTGTVSGVSAKHLADTLVQSSDLVVIAPGTLNIKMTDRISINNVDYTIVTLLPKPASGTRAAWEVIVRR